MDLTYVNWIEVPLDGIKIAGFCDEPSGSI
jgi:hypothetical protein